MLTLWDGNVGKFFHVVEKFKIRERYIPILTQQQIYVRWVFFFKQSYQTTINAKKKKKKGNVRDAQPHSPNNTTYLI